MANRRNFNIKFGTLNARFGTLNIFEKNQECGKLRQLRTSYPQSY